MKTITVGLAARHPVVKVRETSPILRVNSTPIYDSVVRLFNWDPRQDPDNGPRNRVAKKRGHKAKRHR